MRHNDPTAAAHALAARLDAEAPTPALLDEAERVLDALADAYEAWERWHRAGVGLGTPARLFLANARGALTDGKPEAAATAARSLAALLDEAEA